ncbi:MAG: amino acid permease, partial [Deltaproteobacteria bacterium]|nr:amino acid permease [Deltaproteobacteria bacterium]
PFKLPLHPLLPVLGMVSCIYLMFNLPIETWMRFAVWMALGIAIYFGYGYRNSLANSKARDLSSERQK